MTTPETSSEKVVVAVIVDEVTKNLEATIVQDGVLLLKNLVATDQQEVVCSVLLSGKPIDWKNFEGEEYKKNPFLAFCHISTMRWKPKKTIEDHQKDIIQNIVAKISTDVHESLYGVNDGIFACFPENGCAEDHEGRQCFCHDKNPLFPRSTVLDCVEALVYRAGSQRCYHRDAHWIVGLSFGSDVIMGFQRHDHSPKFTVCIPSGSAVIFNGALHSHAVLSITEGTQPSWWKYPFSRVVFLMRDSRQSLAARKRRDARRKAALEGAKQVVAIAAERYKLE